MRLLKGYAVYAKKTKYLVLGTLALDCKLCVTCVSSVGVINNNYCHDLILFSVLYIVLLLFGLFFSRNLNWCTFRSIAQESFSELTKLQKKKKRRRKAKKIQKVK